jgi:thiol-disulfide isomerase/thioredoxin
MNDQSAAKPRGGVLTWALWGAAAIGVAAVVYIIAQSATNAPAPAGQQASGPASGAVPVATPTHDVARKLEHPADGSAPPAYAFVDAAGRKVTLADFKGKVVVMNVWATWCAPCKVEMPTLAKLAKAYEGKPVAVLAVSIDKPEAADQAKAFLAQQAPLAFYNDPEAKLPWALKPPASGMPTTIILGKDGLERGRISGEADWAGEGARTVIDKVLAQG